MCFFFGGTLQMTRDLCIFLIFHFADDIGNCVFFWYVRQLPCHLRVLVGANDTGLCGRFSRCFLAHDMGFMYRFCYVFLNTWHGSLRFLGMSDNSHVICGFYIFLTFLHPVNEKAQFKVARWNPGIRTRKLWQTSTTAAFANGLVLRNLRCETL